MSERIGTPVNSHRHAPGRPAMPRDRAAVTAMGDGRQLVDAAAGQAARAAGAVRRAVRGRRGPVLATAASLLVGGIAFLAGRRSAARGAGPLTRATGGRL